MTRNEIIELAKKFYTNHFSDREIAFAREVLKQAEKQRQWQGLTDEVIEQIAKPYYKLYGFDVPAFARAIEAKLKEENT